MQAGAQRNQTEAQSEAVQQIMANREKELVTGTDLKELELRLLKWQIAVWIALAIIMAKGLGWLGF